MATANAFAYHPPVAAFTPQPGRRAAVLRAAGVAAAAVLFAAPFLAVQDGDPGNAAAAFVPLPSVKPLGGTQIDGGPAEITPATFAIGAAKPFVASYADPASALRAERCLTEAIYYEGALEPERGQRAIAQVVLNRVRHPAYPDTVCGVVFQGSERATGCQFTFTCDGARARAPVPALWARANRIAKAALGGAVEADVGLATHYHADYVMPYWSSSLDAAGRIGRHLFYKWKGGAGQANAFSMRYAGREPLIAAWAPRPATVAAADAPPAPPPLPLGTAGPAGFTPLRAVPLTGSGTDAPTAGEAPAAAPAPALKARPLLMTPKKPEPPKPGDGA